MLLRCMLLLVVTLLVNLGHKLWFPSAALYQEAPVTGTALWANVFFCFWHGGKAVVIGRWLWHLPPLDSLSNILEALFSQLSNDVFDHFNLDEDVTQAVLDVSCELIGVLESLLSSSWEAPDSAAFCRKMHRKFFCGQNIFVSFSMPAHLCYEKQLGTRCSKKLLQKSV